MALSVKALLICLLCASFAWASAPDDANDPAFQAVVAQALNLALPAPAAEPAIEGEALPDRAMRLLRNKRAQEAAWTLDKAGLFRKAEFVHQSLRALLKSAPVVRSSRIGEGVSGSRKLEFGPELAAIAKHPTSNWTKLIGQPQAEAFAYEFDRMIGLGRVPVTVLRDLGSDGVNSLQYMTPRSRPSGIYFYGTYSPEMSFVDEVWIFDHLLENGDRHSGNSMYGPDGDFFLIDHGRSFTTLRSGFQVPVPDPRSYRGPIDADLLRNLHDVPLAAIRQTFTSLIGDALVENLISRIETIRQLKPRPEGESHRRRGWETGEARPNSAPQTQPFERAG